MLTTIIFPAVLLAQSCVATADTPFPPKAPLQACEYLYNHRPKSTYFPNSTSYETADTDYWTAASSLGPACVFAPSDADDMGLAVRALVNNSSPFAIRGGGHMPIAGSNNINSSGVLLSSSGLTQLYLDNNGDSIHVGPGNRWADVYRVLEPHGKLVTGGRLGVVGVPGFMLGGGYSFLGNEFGWASNNVVSFTVVLANGNVVKATADNEYADLFWALRGGGNSFALVTDIELKTFDKLVTMIGATSYVGSNISYQFLDAVTDYTSGPEGQNADVKLSLIPMVSVGNSAPFSAEPSYSTYRFYSGNNSTPAGFVNFTAPYMNVTSDAFALMSMNEWSEALDPEVDASKGVLRQRFHTMTMKSDKKALRIAHDTYLSVYSSFMSQVPVWFTTFTPIPTSKRFLAASAGANGNGLPNGDPMGVTPDDYIMFEFSVSYINDASYESVVSKFLSDADDKIRANLKAAGLEDKISNFLYLNDADVGQDVFGGYPAENVKVLKSIRAKYDPDMVFTKLMPGGWKIANA